MTGQVEHKSCPVCGLVWLPNVAACTCGHRFTTQFNQVPPVGVPGASLPPRATPGPQPLSAGIDPLAELARRHRDSGKVFMWTLLGGFLCVWPLWIVTYLEYTKMRDIKNEIALMGVDVLWWETTYGAKASF